MTLVDRPEAGISPTQQQQPQQQLPARRWETNEPWQQRQNVSEPERKVSLASGAILALLGLGRRDLPGLLIAGVGGAMLHRGATGRCHMYRAIGVNTAEREQLGMREGRVKRGTNISHSFLINRSAQELYDYWRNFENLPRIMSHLESVRVMDERRSHWVAKAPAIAGGKVEWDAEIIADEPARRIAWRSLAGADVDNTGSVEFMQAAGDRGTVVRVVMDYRPPAGMVGRLIAKFSMENPDVQIREDLRKFKRVMETGEVPSVEGQPQGTCLGKNQAQ